MARSGPPATDPLGSDAVATLAEKRVTVMGLGRFGGALGLIRFLAERGVSLTVTDCAPERELAESIAAVGDLPGVRLRIGEHREEDFRACDFLFVNPAVPPANRFLRIAQAAGARIATEVGLFLAQCPATVIAVTGTSGKSTTCALTAAMLEAAGRHVVFGGNVGGSLLPKLESLTTDSTVVLELSSFQLHYLSHGWITYQRPRIAAILNLHDDHLNWHERFSAYAACKQALLAAPTPGSNAWVVVPGDDGRLLPWARASGRSLLTLGSQPAGCRAVRSTEDAVHLHEAGRETFLFRHGDVAVPGAINVTNAASAAALAALAGVDPTAIRAAVGSFHGLPHRMERVTSPNGVTCINSSVATTPLEAARTLEAVGGPSVLIAGGAEGKGQSFRPLALAARRLARYAVLFGEAAPRLDETFSRLAPSVARCVATDLAAAVTRALNEAQSGETVVLAPGCPSFDGFLNFTARGRTFCGLVRQGQTETVT